MSKRQYTDTLASQVSDLNHEIYDDMNYLGKHHLIGDSELGGNPLFFTGRHRGKGKTSTHSGETNKKKHGK